jgi:hypothetical protein
MIGRRALVELAPFGFVGVAHAEVGILASRHEAAVTVAAAAGKNCLARARAAHRDASRGTSIGSNARRGSISGH